MISILKSEQVLEKINKQFQEPSYQYQSTYFAMYSSWYGGIVTDPALMMVPVDDHLVHRGDGVFEAIKVVNGRIYLLNEHLDRLMKSASRLYFPDEFLKSDFSKNISNIIIETVRVAIGQAKVTKENFNGIIRLYLARGPGSFGTNPADSVGPQVYCIVTKLSPPQSEKYVKGVTVGKSQYSIKSDWFSQVKSCNYLQNVLMKKESVDRKLDFTVAFDSEGMLAEGSTENMIVIDRLGRFLHPKLHQILKGTTMTRLFDLVESAGVLPVVRGEDISEVTLLNCQGAFMIGTTLDVLPVCSYESKTLPISSYAGKLLELIREDQLKGLLV